jgi:ribosomal protein S18 acetylase RimI-like enzyme
LIIVANLLKRDLPDVLEMEASYHAAVTRAELIVPGKLAWDEEDYVNAFAEPNQLVLVARKGPEDKAKKVVGALLYARPKESPAFDVLRLIAHPSYEEDFDVRKALVSYLLEYCRLDPRRKSLRVFVHGDDLENMKCLSAMGWKFARLRDADDTYLFSTVAD